MSLLVLVLQCLVLQTWMQETTFQELSCLLSKVIHTIIKALSVSTIQHLLSAATAIQFQRFTGLGSVTVSGGLEKQGDDISHF